MRKIVKTCEFARSLMKESTMTQSPVSLFGRFAAQPVAPRGRLVELTTTEMRAVAGGSPKGGWADVAFTDSPKGGWLDAAATDSPKGGWDAS